MRGERLLERISSAGHDQDKRAKSEQEIIENSIRTHLARMLNTRQGSVPIALDYGVPDYHSMANRFSTDPHESLGNIQEGILKAIHKYEPRLKNIKAKFMEKKEYDITMSLEIEGTATASEGDFQITIRATISAEGRIEFN